MGSDALVLVWSQPSCSCVAVLLNPPFLIATIRLSPVPCPSAVQKACHFRRSSSIDGIFHVAENEEKSQMRDFDGPYLAIGCSDRRLPGADGNGKGRTHWDDKWQARIVPVRAKKRGATRGLPRRSPILVLLSPKHA